MPSPNLRRVRPLVKRFCAANGIRYVESNIFSSYAQALRYFRSLAPAASAG
jgi:hypothetical protein